nr:hypothetical protein 3 [Gammaproteobacteria bacterium]
MAIQLPNPGLGDGQTGDNEFVMWTKVKDNFSNTTHAASRQVGTAVGNVMEVGAFGLGNTNRYTHANPATGAPASDLAKTQMYGFGDVGSVGYGSGWGWSVAGKVHFILGGFTNTELYHVVVADKNAETRAIGYHLIRTSQNTSVDGNGFIKAASPIVKLFADKIELNDEAKQQKITFEKLGVGDYLIKGSLGFAQEGWYIEMPKDANGNVLVAVVYEQLANNDISVKTYDYMLNKKGRIVPDLETPLDIPSTRWIDLRLQALPQSDTKPFATNETVTTNAE